MLRSAAISESPTMTAEAPKISLEVELRRREERNHARVSLPFFSSSKSCNGAFHSQKLRKGEDEKQEVSPSV